MNYLGNKNKFMFVPCQGSNPPEEMVDPSDLDTFLSLRWITYAFIHSPTPLLSLNVTHTHTRSSIHSGIELSLPLESEITGTAGS